jgi:outer membrane protein
MKTLRKIVALATLLTPVITPTTAFADFVSLSIGAGSWQAEPEGNIGRTDIDLSSTLNLKQQTNQFAYIALEHPVPLLPNIRLQHSDLNWSGNGLISAGTDLNGTPFVVAEQADISLDLSHTDATFYYEVLDNVVDLDLGITARLFDGEASLIGATQQQSMALDATVPLLYGKFGLGLPSTGWQADMAANWINVDEFRLVDWSAELSYSFDILPAMDAGIVLGYRSMVIELDDPDELQSDATFDGYYIALQLYF